MGNVNWLTAKPTQTELFVKLRHGPHKHACTIEYNTNATINVKLADRDQGIAPGQFAVFYDGGRCLGGGVIL